MPGSERGSDSSTRAMWDWTSMFGSVCPSGTEWVEERPCWIATSEVGLSTKATRFAPVKEKWEIKCGHTEEPDVPPSEFSI